MHFHDPERPKLGDQPMLFIEGTVYSILPAWYISINPDGAYHIQGFASTGGSRAQHLFCTVENDEALLKFLHDYRNDPEAVILALGWSKTPVVSQKARTATKDVNLADLGLDLNDIKF